MSAAELKLKIITKLASIEDKFILEEISKLVDLESDVVYKLTDDERKAIEYGLQDIKEGKVYSSEAAEEMIRCLASDASGKESNASHGRARGAETHLT